MIEVGLREMRNRITALNLENGMNMKWDEVEVGLIGVGGKYNEGSRCGTGAGAGIGNSLV